MRETSVYFGWHANPQLAQPLDISARKSFGAGTMHNRLLDLGDIPVDEAGDSKAFQRLTRAVCSLTRRGAMPLLLGGDFGMTAPAFEGVYQALRGSQGQQAQALGFLQIGGSLTAHGAAGRALGVMSPLEVMAEKGLLDYTRTVCICPSAQVPRRSLQDFLARGGALYSMRDIEANGLANVMKEALRRVSAGGASLYASVDMSCIASDWHGMVNQPDFEGLSGVQASHLLAALGTAPVAALGLTGLNPTLNPLSVVKTGQRLMVSCLLGFIQAKASQDDPVNKGRNH
jgi:agmatinase